MARLTLAEIYSHPVAQKFVNRAGLAHSISTAFHAFRFAKERGVHPDLAVKAAFLHDMGHYQWYNNGEWDYEQYRLHDIHAIKGAERAHKLLIRLGEDRFKAKQIALAVLFHTNSFIPDGQVNRTALQQIVADADEADEEPGGNHHYRKINISKAWRKIHELDKKIEEELAQFPYENTGDEQRLKTPE